MKKRSVFFALALCLALAAALPMAAQADMGPKDELTIYVSNPPQERYYLDLLWQNEDGHQVEPFGAYDYNETMRALLFSYEAEGWVPALAGGTPVPIFGEPEGVPYGEQMKHSFSYFGVPKTYRIIVVTESGKVTATNAHTRYALQSSVSYDYAVGSMAVLSASDGQAEWDAMMREDGVKVQPVWLSYLLQFAVTCTMTLLLEGAVLLLFRIKLKQNWKLFLLVNLATQIILTAVVGTAFIRYGSMTAMYAMVPAELVIFTAETLLYARFLQGTSRKRAVLYGLAANAASCLAGAALLMLHA